jgi:hypothetical protein
MGGGYPLQDGGGRLVSVLRLPRVGRVGNPFKRWQENRML